MKQTIILVVVLVISLAGSSILSRNLYVQRRNLVPEQVAMQRRPIGGFHKFLADAEWMRYINYLGGIGKVDETNAEEVTRRLEKLISLDPNQVHLYRDGVSFLTHADPEKTLEFYRSACKNKHLAYNGEIPFYAGLLIIRHIEKPDYEEAAKFFQMAMMRPGGETNVRGAARHFFYNCKAHIFAEKNKVDERRALAEVLYTAVRNQREGGMGMGGGFQHVHGGRHFMGPQPDHDAEREMLLRALRRLRLPDYDYTPTKESLDRAAEISKKVFAHSHLCENCMTAYPAGAKFCSSCGLKVELYGVCGQCGVVKTGRFCGSCGAEK